MIPLSLYNVVTLLPTVPRYFLSRIRSRPLPRRYDDDDDDDGIIIRSLLIILLLTYLRFYTQYFLTHNLTRARRNGLCHKPPHHQQQHQPCLPRTLRGRSMWPRPSRHGPPRQMTSILERCRAWPTPRRESSSSATARSPCVAVQARQVNAALQRPLS